MGGLLFYYFHVIMYINFLFMYILISSYNLFVFFYLKTLKGFHVNNRGLQTHGLRLLPYLSALQGVNLLTSIPC